MHGIQSASMLPLVIIVLCYLIFAAQVVMQTNALRTKKARAVLWLVAVFILCASAGYIPQMLSYFFDMSAPIMVAIHEIIHWALAFAAMLLVSTNQAGVIAKMLNAPD